MPHFNVAKIASYLGKYKNQLDGLYDWKFNPDVLEKLGVVKGTELAELQSSTLSHFQKTERLKSILSNTLNEFPVDSQKFRQIALWIIHG